MTGMTGLGENRTHETLRISNGPKSEAGTSNVAHHSEWPSSTMLNLHSPRVFHSLMVRSREAETICRLSAEKDTLEGQWVVLFAK